MRQYFYINGVILPEQEASLSPSDRGLLLGDGLFETIMASEGRPLFLEAHLKRLNKGLEALLFKTAPLEGLFKDIREGIIEKLIEANELSDVKAKVRITISRGTSSGGLAPLPAPSPTVIISATPVDMKKINLKVRLGIKAITIKDFRPALPGVKTLNFMPNILGAAMAKKAGAEEGFFLGEDNRTVLEGTSSNVFIVREGRLMTTPPAAKIGGPGVLPGVVRQIILELAKEAEIPAKEGWFTIDQLKTAEEVFITNSISGVVPVTSVNGTKIGEGKTGLITDLMQKRYEEKIRSYLKKRRKEKNFL